jgi:hypothetical protein
MKRMKLIGSAVVMVLLSASGARAQLNVVNPDNLDVPETRAEILYRQACRIVAEQFHVHDRTQIEFPVTLRIGENEQDLSHMDTNTGEYVVHMSGWNESAFVSRVITVCLFRVLSDSRRKKLIAKARDRADALSAVVSVSQLQRKREGANGLRQ